MPTYEYKREDGTVFEFIQGMNDKPLTTCPDTGQPVKRMISGGGGVVYKGSGWYVTDYKNGKQSAGKDDSKPDSATSNPDAKKSDKPDTPPAE